MPTPRRIGLSLDYHRLYKHHSEVYAGIQRYANERDWLTVVDDWVGETLATSPRGRRAYDGAIARVDAGQLAMVDATAAAGIPLVNVLAASPARDRLPAVFPDYEQAGRLRAEHLLSRGLRHFAFLSTMDQAAYQSQASGFMATVAAAGSTVSLLDLSATWDDTLPHYRQNMARFQKWMDGWELPIGVGAINDNFARNVAQLAHERGWRTPEDVAIVGGLNEEKICETARPTLSSVEFGFERIGYEAARLLETLMDEADAARARRKKSLLGRKSLSPLADPIQITLPPIGVVVRESTDFFAANDDIVAKAHAFIAAQCHTRLEVNEVAAKLCVSPRTLQNRFTEVLRRTVGEEIRRVRLEKAKRELTSSDRSVHEIAIRAGFSCNTRMTEAFKREMGVTPRQYRKQRKIQRSME